MAESDIITTLRELMHGTKDLRVPHYARARKYLDETTGPRPVEKPKL